MVAVVSGGGRERSNTINKTEIEIFFTITHSNKHKIDVTRQKGTKIDLKIAWCRRKKFGVAGKAWSSPENLSPLVVSSLWTISPTQN